MELANTTTGNAASARHDASNDSVARRFARMPRSKSASHSALTAAARWKITSASASASHPGPVGSSSLPRSPRIAATRSSAARSGGTGTRSTSDTRRSGRAPRPATSSERAASSSRARRDPRKPAPPVTTTFTMASPVPRPTGLAIALLAIALQLAPAARSVVADDVLEHDGEGGRVDGFALPESHGAGRLVVVTGGDDPVGIRDNGAVVEKYVDVVLRRQQRADVALQHEVRPVGALDGFGYLRVRGVDQVADLAADGLLPIGQGVDVGIHARVGTVRHGEPP